MIEQLPLNGRNPTQLMQLVAGVLTDTRTSLTSGATYPGIQPVSSSGARANTTNYILDGGSNNDHYSNAPNPMPNPDALQEFSVQTNSFSAEYGRNVGAIVTPSPAGTNRFHGLGFGYLRHYKMNATNFFTPGVDDGLKRNQFGGTLGGPIVKSRTFFFASYQGTTQEQRPVSRSTLVPNAAMRTGDFSSLSRQLRNPFSATGQPFAGNQIPPSLINRAATEILRNWLPLPNPQAGDNPCRCDSRCRSRWTPPVSRPRRSQLQQATVSTGAPGCRARRCRPISKANVLTSSFGRTWQNTVLSLNDTYIVRPNLLNNLVVTFNRTNNDNFQIYPPDYSSLGINAYNDKTPQWFFNVSGYFGINSGDTNQFLRDEYQVSDTLRWTRARHELATGFEYSYGVGDIVNNFRANGRFTFRRHGPPRCARRLHAGEVLELEQGIGDTRKPGCTVRGLRPGYFRVNPNCRGSRVRWDSVFLTRHTNARLLRPGRIRV